MTSRLTHADGPYVRTDGERIADDWDDLVDGEIEAPIDRDENGDEVGGDVWTAARTDGTSYGEGDCDGWTASEGQSYCGATGATGAAWTFNQLVSCSASLPLYCVQQ
ncbi:MAG: hypothetical protein ACODAU_10220 [Myxococcota bacterium]